MSIRGPIEPAIVSPVVGALARGGLPWQVEIAGALSLEAQILGLGGSSVRWLNVISRGTTTLSGSAITAAADASTPAENASQGTGTAQPAFTENAFGSNPGATADGMDGLVTSNINGGSYKRTALILAFKDTVASVNIVADFAGVQAGRCAIVVNDAAGTIAAYGRNASANITARSAANFSMATAGVVTALLDYELATNAAVIRHNGVDVTNSRPENNDATGVTLPNSTLTIGNRMTLDLGLQGAWGVCVLLMWASGVAFPTSTILAIERLCGARVGASF